MSTRLVVGLLTTALVSTVGCKKEDKKAEPQSTEAQTKSAEAPKAPEAPPVAEKAPEEKKLKHFVIEREMPGAGKLTAEQLKGAATKSNEVLASMGGDEKIKWNTSYMTDDKVFCDYEAESAEAVMEHAKAAGFPAKQSY